MLEEETRKKIGDGKTVEASQDRQLPDSQNGEVRTPRPEYCPICKVAELIIQGSCDRGKLQRCFNPKDVNSITNITFSQLGVRDKLSWKGDNSGIYSARTSSVQAKTEDKSREEMHKEKQNERRQSSKDMVKTDNWKFPLSLNVRHKMKHFIRKYLHQNLHVNEEVMERTEKGE